MFGFALAAAHTHGHPLHLLRWASTLECNVLVYAPTLVAAAAATATIAAAVALDWIVSLSAHVLQQSTGSSCACQTTCCSPRSLINFLAQFLNTLFISFHALFHICSRKAKPTNLIYKCVFQILLPKVNCEFQSQSQLALSWILANPIFCSQSQFLSSYNYVCMVKVYVCACVCVWTVKWLKMTATAFDSCKLTVLQLTAGVCCGLC